MNLPALPLIVNDPYFSLWCAGNNLPDEEVTHWAGAVKRVRGLCAVDGRPYRFLGRCDVPEMKTLSVDVTATSTRSVLIAENVELTVQFTTPLLPDDLDTLSTPITFLDLSLRSRDGKAHEVFLRLEAYDDLCYDGTERPSMQHAAFRAGGLNMARIGQRRQKLLCHSGDHITIDWGFLYMAGECDVTCEPDHLLATSGVVVDGTGEQTCKLMLGYDDVASIDYFGVPTKAWYARNGKTMPEALAEFGANHDALLDRCAALDGQVLAEAMVRGGEDYALICAASFRQCIAAHKLIPDEHGLPVLLSKENDSNGCIGTVDVSYPSTPLLLKFNPALVMALCRPILRFAKLPVWEFGYAPHDVGRYPHATGQVYSSRYLGDPEGKVRNGDLHPDWYLYPAGFEVYDERWQMPVEECGNMIIMIYAAMHFGAEVTLSPEDLALLDKWATYLLRFGEDPGDQLCTDDFAGHLAHNVNLAAKAMVGVACYGRLLKKLGDARGEKYIARSHEMAASWLERATVGDHTALTFDEVGWSMKYNLAWDKVLGLGLLDKSFYDGELRSYLPHLRPFGLPLDSRKEYTKSDWILWVASMTDDRQLFDALVAPVAKYLRETPTRVPFSDWYNTVTGRYQSFIARSVQGGVFMPLL